jgi:hypothetical protein
VFKHCFVFDAFCFEIEPNKVAHNKREIKQVMDLGVFGHTNELAIEGLGEDLDVWYKANKEAYKIQGPLTLARIKTSGDWPKLKAKAAATRHIMRYALKLAVQHNSGSIHDQRRLAVCQLLVRFYDILDQSGRYLSEEHKAELPMIAQNFMLNYQRLTQEALGMRLRRWKMVQKFHMFVHLLEIQVPLFGNARFWWCYGDEDFQRIIKKIAGECHPSTVNWMTMYRWAIDPRVFSD